MGGGWRRDLVERGSGIEEEAGPVGRIVERSVAGFGTTVENKVQNGINRQIYEIGKTIDKVLCTSGC